MDNPLLDVRNLKVDNLTQRGPVGAVEDVSFKLVPGKVFGAAGESGSGKTTIAHARLRILPPPALITGRQVLFKGKDLLKTEWNQALMAYRRMVQIIFQDPI